MSWSDRDRSVWDSTTIRWKCQVTWCHFQQSSRLPNRSPTHQSGPVPVSCSSPFLAPATIRLKRISVQPSPVARRLRYRSPTSIFNHSRNSADPSHVFAYDHDLFAVLDGVHDSCRVRLVVSKSRKTSPHSRNVINNVRCTLWGNSFSITPPTELKVFAW